MSLFLEKPETENDKLADLVSKLFQEKKYPKELKKSLGKNYDAFIKAFSKRHPHQAYGLAKELNDTELLIKARESYCELGVLAYHEARRQKDPKLAQMSLEYVLEHDPEQFSDFVIYNDKESLHEVDSFLERAGWKLLSAKPELSYFFGRNCNLSKLIQGARQKIIETKEPQEVYNFALKQEDNTLLELALDGLIKKDPKQAYKLAVKTENNNLKSKAGVAWIKQDPVSAYEWAVIGELPWNKRLVDIITWNPWPCYGKKIEKIESRDKELLDGARRELAEHHPLKAYDCLFRFDELSYGRERVVIDQELAKMIALKLCDIDQERGAKLANYFNDSKMTMDLAEKLLKKSPLFAYNAMSGLLGNHWATLEKGTDKLLPGLPFLATKIAEANIKDNPDISYILLIGLKKWGKIENKKLINKARKLFALKKPKEAFALSVGENDSELSNLSALQLVAKDDYSFIDEHNLVSGYIHKSFSKELFENFWPKFCEKEPSEAYSYAKKIGDAQLIVVAEDKIAKIKPVEAIKLAEQEKNLELKSKALECLGQKFGLEGQIETINKLYE